MRQMLVTKHSICSAVPRGQTCSNFPPYASAIITWIAHTYHLLAEAFRAVRQFEKLYHERTIIDQISSQRALDRNVMVYWSTELVNLPLGDLYVGRPPLQKTRSNFAACVNKDSSKHPSMNSFSAKVMKIPVMFAQHQQQLHVATPVMIWSQAGRSLDLDDGVTPLGAANNLDRYTRIRCDTCPTTTIITPSPGRWWASGEGGK